MYCISKVLPCITGRQQHIFPGNDAVDVKVRQAKNMPCILKECHIYFPGRYRQNRGQVLLFECGRFQNGPGLIVPKGFNPRVTVRRMNVVIAGQWVLIGGGKSRPRA